MTANGFVDEIVALHRARFPLVYVLTHEERRALVELQKAATRRHKDTALHVWRFTTGWDVAPGGGAIEAGFAKQDPAAALDTIVELKPQPPSLCVLCDFDPFMDDPGIVRRLRDLDAMLRTEKAHTVVILSPRLVRPVHLEKALYVLDFPLPDRQTLAALVDGAMATVSDRLQERGGSGLPPIAPTVREEAVRLLAGLTYDEADNIVAKTLVCQRALDPAFIAREKEAAIKRTEVLEVVTPTESLADVGGHELLKASLREAQASLSDDARAFGADPVGGMLFVGIPGAGKSQIVKAAANDWKLPLLRADVGRLMGSLVGESEHRARQLTQIAEAIAPCVLFFDEIEKGLSGVRSSSQTDGGTTARVFGHLLTWMQETTAPVIVLGTANDVTALPPELLRRFDEIFWFDTPDADERGEIWGIHLRRRQRSVDTVDMPELVARSDGYTGAEIEKAVQKALRRAYLDHRRPLTTTDLVEALTTAEPLAKTRRDEMEAAKKALGGLAKPTRTAAARGPAGRRAGVRAIDLPNMN